MGKANSETTRPATLVGTRRPETRERFNPRGTLGRGTDRPGHHRARLTRLVRPLRLQPPLLPVAGDVVHRFRALALVSPAGNVYFGDDEARYEEFEQRCARARAAARTDGEQYQYHSDSQMIRNATDDNERNRAAWRRVDLRRLQSAVSSPHTPQLGGAASPRQHRRQHHSGRESRRRNNARRAHRRARTRNRHLDQLVDLTREPDITEFDDILVTAEDWG
jgi:hypothetical protein